MLRAVRKSRLSWYKQSRLIEHFVAGTTARTAGSLCGVNRKTAAHYFHRLREIIAFEMEAEAEKMLLGKVEVDESYFGGRQKGKRGRGAAGKVPVFGILERGGRVYTQIIPDASSATLYPIIERKVVPDSIVYSDSWKAYNVLDTSAFRHMRINHSEAFADKGNHINGIENFWSQAKRHLRKFNGVPKARFGLFLKECEWRFNHSDPSTQLVMLRQWAREYLN
jgi:transposase